MNAADPNGPREPVEPHPSHQPEEARSELGRLIAEVRRRGERVMREGEAQNAREVARLLALHEAAVALGAPVAPEPGPVRALFAGIVRATREALGGAGSGLILEADSTWRALLVPDDDAPDTGGPPDGSPVAPSGLQTIRVDGSDGARVRLRRQRLSGPLFHVLQSGEPVYISDLQNDPLYGPHPRRLTGGLRALAVVPLRAAGRVLGALAVSYREVTELDAQDRRALDVFAAHAAAAVERVLAAHATRRRVQQAERIAATLASVAAATDLEGALEALVRGAVALLGGVSGTARIFNPVTRERLLSVSLELDGSLTVLRPPGSPWPGGFTEALEAGGGAVLVDDYWALDPETYPHVRHMKQRGLRSGVNVPIDAHVTTEPHGGNAPEEGTRRGRGAGTRVGSLHFDHPEPNHFTATDLALAEALAAHAGAALERIRLEGARTERARMDGAMLVARTVAHEINNALAPIVGYAELLGERPSVTSDAAALTYSRLIGSAAEDAAAKVARLQRIVRLREDPSPLGPDRPVLDMEGSTRVPPADRAACPAGE